MSKIFSKFKDQVENSFKYKSKYKIDYLYFSDDSSWTTPGKLAYILEDTGNNLVFVDKWNKKKYTLDYGTAWDLYILLDLYHKRDESSYEELIPKRKKKCK